MRRIGVLGALLAVACALVRGVRERRDGGNRSTGNRTRAANWASKAYIYGQPLLDMERIFHTSTSVNVATESGYAPVNQFSHFKHLVTTNESVVVAPNDDTLYATGWLELKKPADGGPRARREPLRRRRDGLAVDGKLRQRRNGGLRHPAAG